MTAVKRPHKVVKRDGKVYRVRYWTTGPKAGKPYEVLLGSVSRNRSAWERRGGEWSATRKSGGSRSFDTRAKAVEWL